MKKPLSARQFLYINGELYRRIGSNRSEDIFIARNTETGRVQQFSYRVVKDTHETAYTTKEVSELLGRSPRQIRRVISKGVVVPQKQSYNTSLSGTGRCSYYFKPSDIHELRDYFSSVSKWAQNSRPGIPTKAQLEALISQDVVLYVKTKDGSFVPTWQAKEF